MPIRIPTEEPDDIETFARAVEKAADSIIVAKNGRRAFVAMTPERYSALCLAASRAELYHAIDRAEDDIAAGRIANAADSIAATRKRYSL